MTWLITNRSNQKKRFRWFEQLVNNFMRCCKNQEESILNSLIT